MASSLLALLDDIATVLDDVTMMTKVAAQKTAGVLGDDLALNAEQVSGVRASRELPVVWAVFLGSARNKCILVPIALLLAAFADFLITPLLMLGGCYLCYEGFEKIAAKVLHPGEKEQEMKDILKALHDPKVDLVTIERDKIKGAIRTDFVLSAEIIVIAMGTVQDAAFLTLLGTVVAIAVIMTIGVYGFVAAIVRLDDLGLYFIDNAGNSALKKQLGEGLLVFSPALMKTLTVVGTAAMFLVGGGILAHGFHGIETLFDALVLPLTTFSYVGGAASMLAGLLMDGLLGLFAGALLVPLIEANSEIYHT